jgi:peptidoglycan/xylan/chitin deacetylase (PgdA/CDA1 family)
MLATLKQTAYRMSNSAGGVVARVGLDAWRRSRLLILCYHGVSVHDEHEWDPLLYLSSAAFEQRLALIRRHGCTVLRLDDAVRRLYARDLPARSVVFTFDDGYVDFRLRAWPALQRYSFPATVYLTTQRCEHNFPIARLLASYIVWRARHQVLDGRGIAGLQAEQYPLLTAEQRKVVLAKFSAAMLTMRKTEKDAAVSALASRVGVSYDELAHQRFVTLMNPEEVTQTAAEGASFELHTHRHRTPEDPNLLIEELQANRERIERMTGTTPRHFCYPSGVWRESYLPRLREDGIRSATTSVRALATHGSDPLLLPRVLDHGLVTDAEFEAWLTGAAAWLPRH